MTETKVADARAVALYEAIGVIEIERRSKVRTSVKPSERSAHENSVNDALVTVQGILRDMIGNTP